MEFRLENNRIYFTREGEIGVVSVPHKGCIRFQATASSKLISQDFTLIPEENEAKAMGLNIKRPGTLPLHTRLMFFDLLKAGNYGEE